MSTRDENTNPYASTPHETEAIPLSFGVEELDEAECWRLVATGGLGRFAVTAADGMPDIFPMNYLVHDRQIFVRSAPGGKLRSIAARPGVAFEVDGATTTHFWSVVVHGRAHRLDADDEITSSGVLDLASLSPTPKNDFVRVSPSTITGRRFERGSRHDHDASSAMGAGAAAVVDLHDGSWNKPEPIPHFTPFPTPGPSRR